MLCALVAIIVIIKVGLWILVKIVLQAQALVVRDREHTGGDMGQLVCTFKIPISKERQADA